MTTSWQNPTGVGDASADVAARFLETSAQGRRREHRRPGLAAGPLTITSRADSVKVPCKVIGNEYFASRSQVGYPSGPSWDKA